ncbi:hypothetical protein [Pedobacter immunditicola]|uniref:hypothetical protein n=1 Tax=Pedobacter immunditicola TaxID=3133440 RepID=UPI0030A1A175
MKLPLMICLATAALFSACQNNSKTPATDEVTAESVNEAEPEKECYRYVSNRDTISMSLEQTNQVVTGELAYNFFEKDKSRGKVSGIKNGDTLLLIYNFEAEGTTSEREVAFLKRGNKLIQGFGAEVEKDGSMIFKDKKQLRYDEDGVALTKTDCD